MGLRLISAVVLAAALLATNAVRGATVLLKASNVAIYLGLPSAQLEFENPLAGTETVLGHAVLDWRDADYNPLVPLMYDDWSVYTGGGTIDGNASEIWMRQAGQYIWATTLVPSDIVSIHMTGDQNDGTADVRVDGALVASLNMSSPVVGGTVLIIVRGLANTTHTIEVDCVTPDVHTFGAAALKESPIKWDQPPVTGSSRTNVFNGWNELSITNRPYDRAAADDWVCMSTNPITKIRWWGSFANWVSNVPPSYLPNSFQITIWTDKPASTTNFSHPDIAIWQTRVDTSLTPPQFVGWDIDPRHMLLAGPNTNRVEACFLYEQTLPTTEYFIQASPPGTVYWISIAAEYWQGTAGPWPWGWKTLPRDLASPAPDDAVVIIQPPASTILPGMVYTAGYELFWPDPTNSWDLAFELISEQFNVTTGTKWEQVPDLTPQGMDVNATFLPGVQPQPPPYLLADDFLCTSPGPITNITIWGSWTNDVDWQTVIFALSIHEDIPANSPPYHAPYSMPGTNLWLRHFQPGQYTMFPYALNINEWFFTPPDKAYFPGDHMCFQYDFNIPAQAAFEQEGTPQSPKVYWLDVQAIIPDPAPPLVPPYPQWGWKTCPTNWNDDATWVNAQEPYNGIWQKLTYPLGVGHPREGKTVDMAFRLNLGTTEQHLYELKWSQPPTVFTKGINGWDELSWYGEEHIVADDWVCTNANPVTDIHWWGSFLNWAQPWPPQLPAEFRITFWTDTPSIPGQPGSFSHPNKCVWMVPCTNYTYEFVGWDIDPRDTNAVPEACFLFHQEFSTNEWFRQELFGEPGLSSNIFWVSIAASYQLSYPEYPWGWKTRPRDLDSPAPDDAVRIYDPTAPLPGMPYVSGQPIFWPDWTNSWDMAFYLTTRGPEDQDFGDAPKTYPTLLANTGARHFLAPNFCLGNNIDAELDGQPNWNATGDDANPPFLLNDEDGVTFTSRLIAGTQAWVNVWLTSPGSGTGQLDAWVDFNRNGSWEPGEKIFNNFTLLSGNNALSFPVPTNAVLGPTFARFRLSGAGGLLPAGAAADGEVEDYAVTNYQRRPLTNIVITNIWVANLNANTQAVSLAWTYENDVHYQVRYAPDLGTNYASNVFWINLGPEIIGPAHQYWETNISAVVSQRFYRVVAPYLSP